MAQLLDMEDRAGHQGKPETQSQKGARMFSMSAEVSDGFERSEVQTVMANSIWVLACAAQVAADADVVTLGEAMRGKEWPQFEQAITNEINSLNAKDVFDFDSGINTVPPGTKILPLMILLRRKRNRFGEIERYKARIVCNGSRQEVGKDCFDTFAPVVDYSSVRLLVSLSFANQWHMFHWDISTAFVNAMAEEPVWVRFPPGIPGVSSGTVAKLKKALYGTKSAPKSWYKLLSSFIIDEGFESVAGHPCLFIRRTMVDGKENVIVLALFVDDLIVCGNDLEHIEQFRKVLDERFPLTDNGDLSYYLGVEFTVSKDQKTLKLSQVKFAEKILEKFGMSDCKAVKTPLDPTTKLSSHDCPDVVDPKLQEQYRQIIGSLMWLYVWTRPDLGFSVTFLSRYLHKPGQKHLEAAFRVLRYLKGSKGDGIVYTCDQTKLDPRKQKLNTLYGASDADLAGCLYMCKSTSGYMIFMNGGVVAYHSARQTVVALCTAMAETIALTKVVTKIKHMLALLFCMDCVQHEETLINSVMVWCDNTATLAVANGEDFTHETVKHLSIKVKFLQECVQKGIVVLGYISTEKNPTDILTKQTAGPLFEIHRETCQGTYLLRELDRVAEVKLVQKQARLLKAKVHFSGIDSLELVSNVDWVNARVMRSQAM